MRTYYEYIKNSFKEFLAYRVDYVAGIIQTLLSLLIQIYLWQALFNQSKLVATNLGLVDLKDMITYVLISTLMSTLGRSNLIYDINSRVRSGQVSADLVRPFNFMGYMYCRMIGRNLFNFFFQLLPVLAVGLIFIHVSFPSVPNLLFFVIMTIGAQLILFLITFCLGLLAFWYMSIWQVDILLGTAFDLFSGRWIPLWFFPTALVSISAFLPFKLVYFIPISIYLGKLGTQDCWYAVLQQLIWIVILYGLSRLIWHAAVKKLVIQGG
jgi:ABC-2 type transport system permease protein